MGNKAGKGDAGQATEQAQTKATREAVVAKTQAHAALQGKSESKIQADEAAAKAKAAEDAERERLKKLKKLQKKQEAEEKRRKEEEARERARKQRDRERARQSKEDEVGHGGNRQGQAGQARGGGNNSNSQAMEFHGSSEVDVDAMASGMHSPHSHASTAAAASDRSARAHSHNQPQQPQQQPQQQQQQSYQPAARPEPRKFAGTTRFGASSTAASERPAASGSGFDNDKFRRANAAAHQSERTFRPTFAARQAAYNSNTFSLHHTTPTPGYNAGASNSSSNNGGGMPPRPAKQAAAVPSTPPAMSGTGGFVTPRQEKPETDANTPGVNSVMTDAEEDLMDAILGDDDFVL